MTTYAIQLIQNHNQKIIDSTNELILQLEAQTPQDVYLIIKSKILIERLECENRELFTS